MCELCCVLNIQISNSNWIIQIFLIPLGVWISQSLLYYWWYSCKLTYFYVHKHTHTHVYNTISSIYVIHEIWISRFVNCTCVDRAHFGISMTVFSQYIVQLSTWQWITYYSRKCAKIYCVLAAACPASITWLSHFSAFW